MNKIKLAKEILKLAKEISQEFGVDNQVNQIIVDKLKSNPLKAINELSNIINDHEFNYLVKEVKSASIKIAYKEDVNLTTVKKDIDKWTEFANKLKKFAAGKPKYIIAATAAVLYSYLGVEMSKVIWINGLFDDSIAASINQFAAFILGLSFVSSVPGVYHMIKNILKNTFGDDLVK